MKYQSLFEEETVKRFIGIKVLFGIIFITVIILLLNGCNKIDDYRKYGESGGTSSAQQSTYNVRMTDAPGNFSQVNIDIMSVIVKTDKGNEVTLNTSAGIYNLLDFQNGVDTLLATVGLDSCTISQIRLVLGNRNSVVVDSVLYPLSVPSSNTSGLKLQVHQKVQSGITYNVLIDFDANASIIKTGNGRYQLKPVIRTIDTAISGSIKGLIIPAGVACTIVATDSNNVTYSTNADINGQFILRGLPAGTYNLTITPVSPYSVQVINSVNVQNGQVSLLAAINL